MVLLYHNIIHHLHHLYMIKDLMIIKNLDIHIHLNNINNNNNREVVITIDNNKYYINNNI